MAVPLPRPVVATLGPLLCSAQFADYFREHLEFLSFGPVLDTTRLRTEFGFVPRHRDWHREVADLLAFARRRLRGDYRVDEFGFDPDLTDHVLIPLVAALYRSWFRVRTIGIHHVPAAGSALVVANHSGTLPLDALMIAVAVHQAHPAGRHLRMLGADLLFRAPLLGSLARKSGQTLACVPDAERLLTSGELVGVWPEGFKSIGKLYRDRYKLQRFGRGGFVSAALRAQARIIPCAIVGVDQGRERRW